MQAGEDGGAGDGAVALPAGGSAAVAATAPRRRRRLHAGHFAFMRAVVQGLDARASWDRYLRVEGDAGDRRLVRATIQWMRDEFAAAARRERRHGIARLVLIDAATLGEQAGEVPDLARYARERGLEDFPEAEQLAAWQAEHGAAGGRRDRRARLVSRQLEALAWLERLVAQPPRAGDAVARLAASAARRAAGGGGHRHARAAARPHQRRRPALVGVDHAMGPVKAAAHRRLAARPRGDAGRLGRRARRAAEEVALRARARPRRRQRERVRPLEKLVVPAALDGSRGAYRRPQAECLLQATNDYEAVLSGCAPSAGRPPRSAPTRWRAGARATPAAPARRWPGCQRCRTPSAPTARRPSASCSGRCSSAAGAVVDDRRGLRRLPGLPGRSAAARALVRAEEPRALVAAVAAVRGAAVAARAGACGRRAAATSTPSWSTTTTWRATRGRASACRARRRRASTPGAA